MDIATALIFTHYVFYFINDRIEAIDGFIFKIYDKIAGRSEEEEKGAKEGEKYQVDDIDAWCFILLWSQIIVSDGSGCMEMSNNRIVVTNDFVLSSDALEQSWLIVWKTHEDVVNSCTWIEIEELHGLIDVL